MVLCVVVVVVVGYRCRVVLVRGWAVVVLRMNVPEVLVHVQRRPHGRRDDQGLNQRACDEATHSDQSTIKQISSFGIRLVNPTVLVDFYQIRNRGRNFSPAAEEFSMFLQGYIARWAGRAGLP